MQRNPRTSKIKSISGEGNYRLSQEDRSFLRDLGRTHFISESIAHKEHYNNRKTPAHRRLDKLVDNGILRSHIFHDEKLGKQKVYSFASDSVAKAWGGKQSNFGRNRSLKHELVVTELYFALNRPSDFRKDGQFTKMDKAGFPKIKVQGRSTFMAPDALYTDTSTGEIIFVEGDSGQYTKTQIRSKQVAWKGYRQVWGQPLRTAAPISSGGSVSVFRF